MIKLDCPKLVKFSVILSIFFLVFFPNAAFALSSNTINFQGKIVRNDTGYEGLNVTTGNPACVVAGNSNDTCDFEVKYYSASSGGTLLLTEHYQNTEIGQYNGAFNLSLGSDGSPTAGSYATFDAMIKGVTDLYVQLGFSPAGNASYTETFSRMPIQASAYAIKAKYASGANTAFQFDSAANSSGYTSPVAGMVYYDTTDNALKVYNGSTWGGLGSGTGSLFTDGGIFTYLTALTDHFVLGSSSYTAIGADSYTTYLSGLSTRPSLSFDMDAERLTISGSQAQSGLTVYSSYASAGGWPVATFKAEDSNFDNVVMQITQDGTGNILSLQKGSTDAFVFENPLTFYIHPRVDAPLVSANRLYNVNGTLYWNGSPVGGSSSLWTDGGTFTYLTSTTDDVVIGGSTLGTAAFFFDVSTGNFGIGTSTPGAKLDIAGSNSTISNTTGDITISPDDALVVKANDTQADNLMEWQDSTGAILSLINQNGYATFGGNTGNTGAMLSLGASTSTVAQINLASGFDVAAPNTGDLWWNGTGLYFYDGSNSVDLLTSGGGSNVLSGYGTTANAGYLNVEHDTNSYDVVASGWICVGGSDSEACSGGQWKNVQETDFTITHSLSNQWQDADTDGIIRSIIKLTNIELAPGVNTGTGADGNITITADTDINVTNSISNRSCFDGGDAVNYSVITLATNTATLESAPSAGCLNPGDEVLLINLRGTTTASTNVGNFETLRVSNVNSAIVTFTTPKAKYYGESATNDSNIGLGTTNQIVMLQRVPNYTNVTVSNSGTDFTPSAWIVPNGSANNGAGEGGIMFFRANGIVTVASGATINATAKGYTGGSGTVNGGYSGESIGGILASGGAPSVQGVNGGGSGTGYTANGVAGLNGGGAGGGAGSGDNNDGPGGGGGGGYAGGGGGAGAGGDNNGNGGSGGSGATTAGVGGGGGGGGNSGYGGAAGSAGLNGGAAGSGYTTGQGGRSASASGGAGGGGGGGYYGVADLSSLYFGSGGGAGGGYNGGYTGSNGGAGGGIVMISGSTITVSGSVSSNGGGGGAPSTYAAAGGGGAGGSVRINGQNLTLGSSLVTASGGGGGSYSTRVGGGGSGSIGVIAVYYATSITGSTSPSYSGTSVGYYNYGVYNSPVISTPNAQSYDNLRWDASLNTYGKISVQTRSGATSDPTDGTWEGWKPYTSGTSYTTLETADTHTTWTGTNATVAEGDITKDVDYFEDEDEPLGTNITKVTSSTNGGYMESTITAANLTNYDYVTLWVRASQAGNVLRIGIGEAAGTEQYEDITIDVANVWQKVYWDLSDISAASRDAITKIRLTNFSAVSNTIYLDNVRAEKLLSVNTGSTIASTPNQYFQYRVIFTTTNLSYQPQLENISLAYNSGYRIVMYDANNVRLYNYSGGNQYMRLEVVASTGAGSSGGGFVNGLAVSHVADGEDAIAFQFNTSVAFTNPSSKLLSVMNNSVEKMYLDANGNLYVSGTITSGKGLGVTLVNNSGITVPEATLVTLDSSTNGAFTITDVPGQQGAFGVIQGVEVNGDLDKDGNCDDGDTCLVAIEGIVKVMVNNAGTTSRGDYVYSSDVPGVGYTYSGTSQKNGLIGVVTSIADAGMGYVNMVFDAQNKVTADMYLNVSYDENVYKDIYNQLANDYTAMSDAERRGYLESNQSQTVMFDNFVDSLKIDSTNSTIGVDADAKKAGLWGGVTIDSSMLDIAGNRYLGSATATLLTSKYYDRTQSGLQDQDSTPATLVAIGVDPNWYKGVSLQTTSNLTTSYNGSLIGVSGVYGTGSEHGYIDLTITGTTTTGITANIVSSDGNCTATGANLAFGSSYAFVSGSCSGSSITIKPVRSDYKNGDKFRIASWVVEPTTTDDRGSKREFPERSVILASSDASNGYITIIDVDTQRVWMKFVQSSTGEMLGVALNNTISSISMGNGTMNVGMNGSAATGMYSVQFNDSQVFKYNTSGKSISNKNISDRNIANTYSVVNAGQALVNNIVNDVSSATVPNQPTQNMTVSGWGYILGNGTTDVSETAYYPYVFGSAPQTQNAYAGFSNSVPTKISDCIPDTSPGTSLVINAGAITEKQFTTFMRRSDAATFSGTAYYCYTWTATGYVSPKQVVAVATGATGVDGGVTVINKTDQNSTNYLIGSLSADVAWQNRVVFDTKGNLYAANNSDTGNNTTVSVYNNVLTRSSDTTWATYRSGYYQVGSASAGWSLNGVSILGSNLTNQIKSLYVKEGASTIDGKSNTIYVGTSLGLSVVQEKQSGGATLGDGADEKNGSVKYYTKDYITEQMVGDVRGTWPLNGSGSIVNNASIADSSIKGSVLKARNTNGTGMSYVSGIRGTAISLDGVDDALWIDVDNDNTIDYYGSGSGDDATNFDITTSNLSMGIWIKTSTSDGVIMGKGLNDGNYTSYRSYDFTIASGKVKFNTFSGESYVFTTSNTSINDGQWHYIVGTFDNVTDVQSLYIDGQFEASATRAGNLNNVTSPFAIGVRDISGVLAYTAGSIDEPFVTATAIPAAQIKSQYEDGLRALKGSHTSADTYNQLSGTSNDIRDILVTPDSKYMYVGTEGGGISKIDLTSSTRLNAYTTATDPSTSTNNIETLSGRYYPVFAGDIGSSGRLMGIDSNGNNSTGTYYSNVTTFAESTNRAFLWMTASIDPTDTSSSITVSASNDNGSNYVTGTLIQTNTSGSLPEYEYSFVFPTSDKNYKVKFEITRGSSNKATAYITKWGLSQMKLDTATVNGLYTNSNDTIANGSYLEVVHGQNTYDLVANGWVFDTTLNKWVEVTNTDNGVTQNLSNQWQDANVNGIIRSIVKLTDVELAPGVNTGTGADGAITVSSNTVINATNLITGRTCVDGGDAVNYSVTAFNAAGTEATLSTSPSTGCLNINDEVLIINLQGTATAYGNVGNYETLRVASVNGTTVTFKTAKSKYYGTNLNDDANLGTTTSNQRVMLQRVPNYTNVTVNSGIYFAPIAWNGSKGGVLFFRASGAVSVAGYISATGIGYRAGAAYTNNGSIYGGWAGEAFCGYGGGNANQYTQAGSNGVCGGGGGGGSNGGTVYAGGTGSATGGAGGGGGGGNGGTNYGAGGAGGGYGTYGMGGNDPYGAANKNGGTNVSGNGYVGYWNGSAYGGGGGGGGTYGDANLNQIFFGSGGGGGGTSSGYGQQPNTGLGGGIIMISSNSLSISGSIQSNGAAGNVGVGGQAGGGGGGAGGAIKIAVNSAILGTNLVTANGGAGGDVPSYDGGAGGSGRIAVNSTTTVSGVTSPGATAIVVGYYNYGIYNSGVISTTNAQSYDNLKWDAALNTYGKISVQTRSGATADPTDGTWEAWKPSVSGTNVTTLQNADTHTDWTGTNATVAEGDITRPSIYGFEDEIEPLGTNVTKVTSSTNGGYMESTIAATDLTNYDYVSLWVRASQAGNTLRIGMGESAGTEQYEEITIDTANVWQKVYWDISDIAVGSKDAITKLRLTNFSTSSNVIYLDNVKTEKLLSTSTGSVVASTPNQYFQYRVIFTTTNLSYQPQLENITFTYSSGFKIQIVDENRVRLYNNSGKAQKLKLDVILGGAAIDLRASEYTVNIAPNAAQIDGGNYTNSIWINKMGTGGNLLKLQTNSVDMMVVSSEGDMTLAGDVAISGGSISLGTDGAGVRYNTTDGNIEFSNDGIAWMPLGEMTRKVILSAEYGGAVLSGDGTDNVGSMTSDNTGSSSNSMNYYEWSSSALSLNDYDLRVRFTLPSDFNGWGSTGGVKLNYATESTSNTNNKVDMYIYKEGSVTVDGTFTAGVSSSAGVWTNSTIAGTDLNECAVAGDTCVFIMRMSSLGDNYVRIGDIAVTYNRSL